MLIQISIYSIFLIIFSIISLFLIKYGYDESKKYLTISFIGLTLSLCLSLFFEGLYELFVPSFFKLFFVGLSSLGYSFLGFFWFLFVLAYIGRTEIFKKKYILLLLIIPISTVFAGVTEPWLYLLWKIEYVLGNMVFERTIIFWMEIAYSFILGIFATILLVYYLFKKSSSFRVQVVLLLLAIISPLVAAILRFTEIFAMFNLIPFSFFISIILIIIAVFYYNSVYYVPYVHDRFIESIDVGMMFFDENNILIDMNSAASMVGVNRNYINQSADLVFQNNSRLLNFYISEENLIEFHNEGSNSWLEIAKENIEDKKGNFIGFVLTLTDISSKKELLLEKDMLLKEVHHRVKNNLQIILSLLNLDFKFHPDDLELIINDTKTRINTMALIHEKVYNSSSLHEVNLKDYLLDILRSLLSLYSSSIKINDNLIDLDVDLELAIPLGLIFVELMNNVIKYAFPNEDGNVFIDLSVNGDLATLLFYDDGVGLSDDVDVFDSPSLGLTVVNSLIKQIEGNLSIYECDGAGFKIEFKYST